MGGLSRNEYEALIRVGQAGMEADGTQAWLEVVAEESLGSLFHADVLSVASIDFRSLTGSFGMIRPAWAELTVPTGSEMHQDLLAGHPMTRHLQGPDAWETVRVSDLVPPLSWRRMAGYAKMRELIGATHQLGVTIMASPRRSFSVSPIRSGADFTDHEVAVARRLQPLLQAADRSLRARERQRARLTDVEQAAVDDAATQTGLTRRELVVLGLLAEGLTTAAVGRRLAVSPRTVNKHQEHVYRKLGVGDRLAAVLRAQEAGLLVPRQPQPGPTGPRAAPS